MTKINITLYKAEWCGFCQRFKSDWEKIKKVLEDNETIKKELIKRHDIELILEEFDDKAHKEVFTRESIVSYPTLRVKVINGSENKTFDLESRELESFINQVFADKSKDPGELLISEDLKKTIIKELKKLEPKKELSGGFFDYSRKKEHRYYKEYLRCKKLYLELKNK